MSVIERIAHVFCGGEILPRYTVGPRIICGPSIMGPADLLHLAELGVMAIVSLETEREDPPSSLPHCYAPFPDDGKSLTPDIVRRYTAFAGVYAETRGSFYVHCQKGRCRGPSTAYAIARAVFGLSHTTALAEIQTAHPDWSEGDHVRVRAYLKVIQETLGFAREATP